MVKKKSAAPDTAAVPVPAATRRRSIAGAAAPRTRAGNGTAHPIPTHEEIAEAAYLRYLSRQGRYGSDFDDWVEAERELRSRRSL